MNRQIIYFLLLITFPLSSCAQYNKEIYQNSQNSDTGIATKIPLSETVVPTKTHISAQTPSPEPAETLLPTALPTPIPINHAGYENWLTYIHPTYGFSIRLPDDWVVRETTTGNPMMNGHLINIHPENTDEMLNIRATFRAIGDDIFLWPTGVGQGELIHHGMLDVAGGPVKRILLICPTGQIQSIFYQGENGPNIQRDNLEFGFIFEYSGVYCQEGFSINGKVQHTAELIIASLETP